VSLGLYAWLAVLLSDSFSLSLNALVLGRNPCSFFRALLILTVLIFFFRVLLITSHFVSQLMRWLVVGLLIGRFVWFFVRFMAAVGGLLVLVVFVGCLFVGLLILRCWGLLCYLLIGFCLCLVFEQICCD
jgi:hypothetical protein